MKSFILTLTAWVLRLINIVVFLVILITLVGIASPYFSDASSYPYITKVTAIDKQINDEVKANVPTKINNQDISHWLTLIVAIILLRLFGRVSRELTDKAKYYRLQTEVKKLGRAQTAEEANKVASLHQKLDQIKTAKKRDREQLLNEFVTIKKQLENMGRELAFLSIDVIDSTAMKEKEDTPSIEHDFIEYRRFVEAKLKNNGCIKATWTPDGVMACFNTVDDAVRAAQDIITGLEYFNKDIKVMKRDFAIRCGVNYGYLYFDDNTPLEEVSDRVIDIAGHMQKNAGRNQVLIAKSAIEPLKLRQGFNQTEKIIDGVEVYEWEVSK